MVSTRQKVLLGAIAAGAVVGLFLPFSVVAVAVVIAAFVAVATGVRAEGRTPRPPVWLSPLPWVLFAAMAVLFWLIGAVGLVLGMLLFLALVIAFFVLGGDLG